MSKISSALRSCLVAIIASCFVIAAGANAQPITIAVHDYPPYQTVAGTKIDGPMYRIAKTICTGISLNCVFKGMAQDAAYAGLGTGSVDVVLAVPVQGGQLLPSVRYSQPLVDAGIRQIGIAVSAVTDPRGMTHVMFTTVLRNMQDENMLAEYFVGTNLRLSRPSTAPSDITPKRL